MKILHLFPEEFSGRFAREYHVYRLAQSLADAGLDVTLAAAPSAHVTHHDQLHALFGGSHSPRLNVVWIKRQIELGPVKIRSGAWFYRQLDALLSELQPAAVYTMHVKAANHLVRKHPHLPLIFEAHEIFADTYPENASRHRQLFAMEQSIYTHARAVVAISTYLAECLRARFHLPTWPYVQHDGIDESMLLDPAISPVSNELIYAGSLQPWKGVPVAIDAMRLLPDYHLTVLGGTGQALDDLRRRAPANVTFAGQVSRNALEPYLQKAAIGLMPNLLEPRSAHYTFPLKLLEYSAAGKGIVASRIPIFEQLHLDAWVHTVPSGSPEALAAGVRALAQRGIDRTAAQQWAAQFLWAKQGLALKTFLESLLLKSSLA